MERLSGLDAGMLYSESTTVPLHVCSVMELDPSTTSDGYSFAKFCAEVEKRVPAVPEFRCKLADNDFNLDHPVWVEDEDFELSRHLNRVALPAPGGRQELSEVCGHIASVPLDRSKPLWEMWVIEGLGGSAADEGGDVVLMIKVHHAAVDGVSAANLLDKLCDIEPNAATPEPVDGPGAVPAWAIAADGLWRFVTLPWQLTRAVPVAASMIAKTVGRVVSGESMAAPFTAPTTRFNGTLTAERTIATVQLDLDDVKKAKNQCDAKVNDVVMALCAGALRGYLADHGELPDKPLIAMVPSSVQGMTDRPGRNQLSGMFCNLQTHIEDPVQRLHAIAESNRHAKEHSASLGPTLLLDLAQSISRGAFGAMMGLMSRSPLGNTAIHNVIVSNVPGPPMSLYSGGAEVKGLYPLGPIFPGSGLNITVVSVADKLNVGIISCPQLADDLWGLADRFKSELSDLLARC